MNIQSTVEDDHIDLRSSLERVKQAVLSHLFLISVTTLFTLAVVTLYMVIWPSTYSSQVVLVAEAEKDSSREAFYQDWNVFRKEHLADEVQLVTAGPLLEKVIIKLDLHYDEVYHSFFSYAGHLWVNSWVGKKYRKIKKWLFPPQISPYAPTEEDISHGEVLNDFRSGVALVPYPETNVGRLVVKGSTPRTAEIVNTLVQIFLNERQMRHVGEAENAYESLRQETEKAQVELLGHEGKMKEYFDNNTLLLNFEKDKVEISRWVELQASIVNADFLIASQESQLKQIKNQLSQEKKEIVSSRMLQRNTLRETLKSRLLELQTAKTQLFQKYSPEAPELIEFEAQIQSVQRLISSEEEEVEYQRSIVVNEAYEAMRAHANSLQAEIQGAKSGNEVRKKADKEMKKIISSIPEKMQIIQRMERERQALEKKYTILNERMTMAQVSKATAASAPPTMRVVEPASAPEKPTWPKKKLLLSTAVILGLLGGLCLALLVDVFHGRVNYYQMRQSQGGVSIYAVVNRDPKFVAKLFRLSKGID